MMSDLNDELSEPLNNLYNYQIQQIKQIIQFNTSKTYNKLLNLGLLGVTFPSLSILAFS